MSSQPIGAHPSRVLQASLTLLSLRAPFRARHPSATPDLSTVKTVQMSGKKPFEADESGLEQWAMGQRPSSLQRLWRWWRLAEAKGKRGTWFRAVFQAMRPAKADPKGAA